MFILKAVVFLCLPKTEIPVPESTLLVFTELDEILGVPQKDMLSKKEILLSVWYQQPEHTA